MRWFRLPTVVSIGTVCCGTVCIFRLAGSLGVIFSLLVVVLLLRISLMRSSACWVSAAQSDPSYRPAHPKDRSRYWNRLRGAKPEQPENYVLCKVGTRKPRTNGGYCKNLERTNGTAHSYNSGTVSKGWRRRKDIDSGKHWHRSFLWLHNQDYRMERAVRSHSGPPHPGLETQYNKLTMTRPC